MTKHRSARHSVSAWLGILALSPGPGLGWPTTSSAFNSGKDKDKDCPKGQTGSRENSVAGPPATSTKSCGRRLRTA